MYRVKEDISIGFNTKTGKPNLLFKKGDLIDGQVVERYIFNSYNKGISVKPTIADAVIETPDGKSFLLLEKLEKIDDNISYSKLINPKEKGLTGKQISFIGLSLVLGGIFLLFLSKNISSK